MSAHLCRCLVASMVLLGSHAVGAQEANEAFEVACDTDGVKTQHLRNNGSSLHFVGSVELKERYLVDPSAKSVTLLSRKGYDRPDPNMTGVPVTEVNATSQFYQDVRAMTGDMVVVCPDDTDGCKQMRTELDTVISEKHDSLIVMNLKAGTVSYSTTVKATRKNGTGSLFIESKFTGACSR